MPSCFCRSTLLLTQVQVDLANRDQTQLYYTVARKITKPSSFCHNNRLDLGLHAVSLNNFYISKLTSQLRLRKLTIDDSINRQINRLLFY